MDPNKNTVKTRIIRGLGELGTVQRPRQLQGHAETAEHHVVHELYAMEKQNLVTFKIKKSVHSPGRNLTSIKLTPKGKIAYREMKRD